MMRSHAMSVPRVLTPEEKAELRKATIYTGTATGQSGSVLQMMLSGESGPLRFAENANFKSTSLSDLLAYSQKVGDISLPDGVIVSYAKEVIYSKIESGELTSEKEVSLELTKLFKKMYQDFNERLVLNPAQRVVDHFEQHYEAETERYKQLNAPAKAVEEQRLAEIERQRQIEIENKKQMMATINNFKTAITDIQKINKTIFTPTGIKAMQAEMKKFDALPNPTNQDRRILIDKIKKIAETRLNEKKSGRGKMLEEFYRKVSKAEVGQANTFSQEHMGKAQIAISALVTIQILTTKNNGPTSTFGKIHELIGQDKPAMDKMTEIKKILEARLKDGSNLKSVYKQEYKALIKFIREVERGRVPDLDVPKMLFLKAKLEAIKKENLMENLRQSGLIEKPKTQVEKDTSKPEVARQKK